MRRDRGQVADELAAGAARGGAQGWALVETARSAVAGCFTSYCVLYPWESPGTAYRRGRGYCVQYNGLLYRVLRRLRFDCRLVFAARVRVHDDPSWRGGHAWVRVLIGGRERDVCAHLSGVDAERPGFAPVTRVHELRPPWSTLASAGMWLLAGALHLRRVLGGAVPTWAYQPFDPATASPRSTRH